MNAPPSRNRSHNSGADSHHGRWIIKLVYCQLGPLVRLYGCVKWNMAELSSEEPPVLLFASFFSLFRPYADGPLMIRCAALRWPADWRRISSRLRTLPAMIHSSWLSRGVSDRGRCHQDKSLSPADRMKCQKQQPLTFKSRCIILFWWQYWTAETIWNDKGRKSQWLRSSINWSIIHKKGQEYLIHYQTTIEYNGRLKY